MKHYVSGHTHATYSLLAASAHASLLEAPAKARYSAAWNLLHDRDVMEVAGV